MTNDLQHVVLHIMSLFFVIITSVVESIFNKAAMLPRSSESSIVDDYVWLKRKSFEF